MKLFENTQIGNMKLRNRIFMGTMSTAPESDGGYTIDRISYFEEMAKGGVGLIITDANEVFDKYEIRMRKPISQYGYAIHLSTLIERCHYQGAKVCVQLSPDLGRMLYTDITNPSYSTGDCHSFYNLDLKCRSLTIEQIHVLVGSMEKAADIAKNAGADALELYVYGGYLMDQFMTALWNNREDEYGGSLENRLRFAMECLEAMKIGSGYNIPIFIKYTIQHGIFGGRELPEGVKIAKLLEESELVDAIHIDTNYYDKWYKSLSTVYNESAELIDFTKVISQNVSLIL